MSKLMDLLGSLYQSEMPPELRSPITPQKEELLKAILKKLISYGFVNDKETALDWKEDLADLSEAELIAGWKKAKDHTGYLEFGRFREMCKLPVSHASFRSNLPAPVTEALEADDHHRRTTKMKEELGL